MHTLTLSFSVCCTPFSELIADRLPVDKTLSGVRHPWLAGVPGPVVPVCLGVNRRMALARSTVPGRPGTPSFEVALIINDNDNKSNESSKQSTYGYSTSDAATRSLRTDWAFWNEGLISAMGVEALTTTRGIPLAGVEAAKHWPIAEDVCDTQRTVSNARWNAYLICTSEKLAHSEQTN